MREYERLSNITYIHFERHTLKGNRAAEMMILYYTHSIRSTLRKRESFAIRNWLGYMSTHRVYFFSLRTIVSDDGKTDGVWSLEFYEQTGILTDIIL